MILEALKRTEGALEDIDADLRDGEKTLKRISFMNKVPLIFLPLYLMLKGLNKQFYISVLYFRTFRDEIHM